MRILLPALIFLLTSCMPTFHYLTITGENTIKNDRKELVAENDTLKVVYSFHQTLPQLSIVIYNKSDEPIEINWAKSAIVMNGRSHSIFQPSYSISGNLSVDTSSSGAIRSAGLHGSATGEGEKLFLPPRSSVSKEVRNIQLPYSELKALSFDKASRESEKYARAYRFEYQKRDFGTENSPVRFRSFLSVTPHSGKEFWLDHAFYVSEYWRTENSPTFTSDSIKLSHDKVLF